MNGRHSLLTGLALVGLLLGPVANAAHHEETVTPESFEEMKLLADEAYETKRYREAFKLFRDTLARHGDAYSQYMTGYMLRTGLGTDRDLPTGTAWMMLAGEQGNLQLMESANLAAAALKPGDERRANKILRDLRRQYGNCALLNELVVELKDNLTASSRPGNAKTERISAVYGAVGTADELRERIKLQEHVYERHCTR